MLATRLVKKILDETPCATMAVIFPLYLVFSHRALTDAGVREKIVGIQNDKQNIRRLPVPLGDEKNAYYLDLVVSIREKRA